jgi:crossover junction endodeoxyribonuclease RuvC
VAEHEKDLAKGLLTALEATYTSTSGGLYIGVDPGAEGAVGFVNGDKAVAVDIPTVKVSRKGGTKTEFALPALAEFTTKLCRYTGVYVLVEEAQVQIRGKGCNAYTGFRVGCAYAIWPALLTAGGARFETVHPTRWKRAMGLWGKDKEAARLKAMGMFPGADLLRKKDHNRAEALLIAEYHRRQIYGG